MELVLGGVSGTDLELGGVFAPVDAGGAAQAQLGVQARPAGDYVATSTTQAKLSTHGAIYGDTLSSGGGNGAFVATASARTYVSAKAIASAAGAALGDSVRTVSATGVGSAQMEALGQGGKGQKATGAAAMRLSVAGDAAGGESVTPSPLFAGKVSIVPAMVCYAVTIR